MYHLRVPWWSSLFTLRVPPPALALALALVLLLTFFYLLGGSPDKPGKWERVFGLHAIDPIPENTALIYPGQILDEYQIVALKEKFGSEFTHEYGKGGPKGHGVQLVIFANTVSRKKNPYACGGRVNSRKAGSGQVPPFNCTWGQTTVTQEIKDLFPESADHMIVGKLFTCLRFSKPVNPGEEIICKSYGRSFWSRIACERENILRDQKGPVPSEKEAEKLFRHKTKDKNCFTTLQMLNPHHRRLLQDLDLSTLTRDKRRAKKKTIKKDWESKIKTARQDKIRLGFCFHVFPLPFSFSDKTRLG